MFQDQLNYWEKEKKKKSKFNEAHKSQPPQYNKYQPLKAEHNLKIKMTKY